VYNKLFTKILDSSIWLESDSTRLVWITLIAAMDGDGFAGFSTLENLALRARVDPDSAAAAVAVLEAPDPHTGAEQEHEGRRIQRVPGGWLILNAAKYRELVSREVERQRTRERVARFRARLRESKPQETVTKRNVFVTQSETEAEAKTEYVQPARALPIPLQAGGPGAGTHPRDHLKHSFCAFRVPESTAPCVPAFLHGQFLGQIKQDADRLEQFYRRVAEQTRDPCSGGRTSRPSSAKWRRSPRVRRSGGGSGTRTRPRTGGRHHE
jgi:hypothetical protein